MNESSKQNMNFVREHYNCIAHDYEEIVKTQFKLQFGTTVKRLFTEYQILSGELLDIGCGPGNFKDEIRDLKTDFSFIGVDISSSMLELAKIKGYSTEVSDALSFLKAQDSSSFDHIICVGMLSLVTSSEACDIIQEIARVARRSWLISLEQYTQDHLQTTQSTSGLLLHDHSKIRFNYDLNEDFKEIRRYRPRDNNSPEAVYSRYLFQVKE